MEASALVASLGSVWRHSILKVTQGMQVSKENMYSWLLLVLRKRHFPSVIYSEVLEYTGLNKLLKAMLPLAGKHCNCWELHSAQCVCRSVASMTKSVSSLAWEPASFLKTKQVFQDQLLLVVTLDLQNHHFTSFFYILPTATCQLYTGGLERWLRG